MKPLACAALLTVAVLASALGVVVSRHESRVAFVELQALERERDAMNEEWGQLQLEQATWGTHARVEDIAHQQLDMWSPPPESTLLVVP
ncbi:MAG TPA: cell division protein FtsL [Gammaproteobacteria bacterium]|nr:cell division protein FtsL [Gammaproteobacteria bacterium]